MTSNAALRKEEIVPDDGRTFPILIRGWISLTRGLSSQSGFRAMFC
jgi:hypothetical protein